MSLNYIGKSIIILFPPLCPPCSCFVGVIREQMHWAFFNDFVFSKLLQRLPFEEARVMTILDVGGFRPSMMMAGGNNGIAAVK